MSLVSKILFVVCFAVTLVVTGASFALAATSTVPQPNTGTTQTGQPNLPDVQTVTLQNPLVVNSLEDLIVAILNIFITLMIPIIVFFIILAGFKYVTAQGNPGQIEEATTTFTYAVIGGVLILAAVAIAEIIKNTVDSFSV
jgi:hypothetical protein